MTACASPKVRGWCPGALQPMQSGDGLLVRIRPKYANLTIDQLRAIALAAQQLGSGLIDLTRRGNIQIRGVKDNAFHGLCAALDSADLLDDSVAAEQRCNLIISPLAGHDPRELIDVRPIADQLSRHMERDACFSELPTKFGVVLDGGGAITLDDVDADVRLKAIGSKTIALGIAADDGVSWLGSMTADGAGELTAIFLRAFLSLDGPKRLSQLSIDQRRQLHEAMQSHLKPLGKIGHRQSHCPRQGPLAHEGNIFAVGAAAPLGRIESDQLLKLCDDLLPVQVRHIRISPWRTIYLPVRDPAYAREVLSLLRTLRLIIDPNDPILRIDACPGAPHCASTKLDTRTDAQRIAEKLSRENRSLSIHVSGCAKGCARSAQADIVLVGNDDHYGVVRNGCAGDAPVSVIAAHEVDDAIDTECPSNSELCHA